MKANLVPNNNTTKVVMTGTPMRPLMSIQIPGSKTQSQYIQARPGGVSILAAWKKLHAKKAKIGKAANIDVE